MGTPLLAGPGAISTVILYAQRYTSVAHYLYLLGVILLIVCLTFFSFRLAPAITRLLGKTGINVVTRLMGLIIANGLKQLFPVLGGYDQKSIRARLVLETGVFLWS